jgi:hypothetical protein
VLRNWTLSYSSALAVESSIRDFCLLGFDADYALDYSPVAERFILPSSLF